jgi:hypothetical protein
MAGNFDDDDDFSAEFGDFQSAIAGRTGENENEDRESTPTAESWSFTSSSSSGLTDSAEEFGIGSKTAGEAQKAGDDARTAGSH